MKKNKAFIIGFITPCALSLLVMYLYPVLRTVIMSFFGIESVTADVSDWTFNGVANYIKIFSSPTFQRAMTNMILIWFVGGIIVLALALLFAVILTSGIRFKKFFRAAIYLPNIISAVALATMWIQYIYNQDYGLLNQLLEAVGLKGKNWLGTDMKFWAMLAAFIFGAVGYYMLIFISGIERIPEDLYESADIDGASSLQKFRYITLPLLKPTTVYVLTISIFGGMAMFTESYLLFNGNNSPNNVGLTVVGYLYRMGLTQNNIGLGSAIGVVLLIIVLIINVIQLILNGTFSKKGD